MLAAVHAIEIVMVPCECASLANQWLDVAVRMVPTLHRTLHRCHPQQRQQQRDVLAADAQTAAHISLAAINITTRCATLLAGDPDDCSDDDVRYASSADVTIDADALVEQLLALGVDGLRVASAALRHPPAEGESGDEWEAPPRKYTYESDGEAKDDLSHGRRRAEGAKWEWISVACISASCIQEALAAGPKRDATVARMKRFVASGGLSQIIDVFRGAEKESLNDSNRNTENTDATVVAEDMGTRTQNPIEKQNEGVSTPFRCRIAAGHLIDAFEYLPHADLSRLAALQS